MFKDLNVPKNDTSNSVEDLSQRMNEMIEINEMNGWHYKEQNTRNSDTSNNLMKFTLEITKAWFLQVRGKFFEKLQNGKAQQN